MSWVPVNKKGAGMDDGDDDDTMRMDVLIA